MNTIPVLRLTLEHMRQQLSVALAGYVEQLDSDLQAAVEDFCTPDNLHRIIHDEVQRLLPAIIAEGVERYYRFGEGRAEVLATMERYLKGARRER